MKTPLLALLLLGSPLCACDGHEMLSATASNRSNPAPGSTKSSSTTLQKSTAPAQPAPAPPARREPAKPPPHLFM